MVFCFFMDRKPAYALLLGLLAATGIWLLNISTPYGLGLIDDAISYIAAARALLSGQGFTRIWLASGLEPITHWPPGFSATLAALSFLLKIDPYRSARLLNMLVFGGNAALLALLSYKMTKSHWWGGFLSLLFLLNSSILRLHAQALSEPLYLFVSLLGFWAFYRHFEKANENVSANGVKQSPRQAKAFLAMIKNAWNEEKYIILAGLLTSLSYLTRYAALSLLATFIVAIFVLRPTWRKRFTSLTFFLLGAMPLIFAWMLRNKFIGGSVTNRAIKWHPVTVVNARRGLREFFSFLIPLQELRRDWFDNYSFVTLILVIMVLSLLFWLLWRVLKYFLKPKENMQPEVISFTTALYIFGYMGSLLVSLSFFDAATPLNDRILSPVYIAVLMLLVYFLHKLFWQGKIAGRILSISATIFFFAIFGLAQINTVKNLQETTPGFASWRWRDSTVMAAIRELPDDVMVYTNQQPAVYFWTGRPAMILATNEAHILQVKESILAGEAVLAYFPQENTSLSREEERLWQDGLPAIEKSGLGNLYGKMP